MRSTQKFFCWLILFLSFLLFDAKRLSAQADLVIGKSVYIWSFLPPDSTYKTIATSFTNEFEDALVETGKFVVLQRRKRPRIVEQFENEKRIMGIKQFSKAEIDALSKALKVDAVIFGEITDDLESGLLQIRVAAESFDERILMRKSIFFPRWQKSHLPSRQDSMKVLVKKIVPSWNGPSPEGPIQPQPPKTQITEVDNFVFELQSCKLSGRNLTCKFLITNKGEDGDIGIAPDGTRVFDPDGNEYIAKLVNIGARGASARITAGAPVKLTIDFGTVPVELKHITGLEIQLNVKGSPWKFIKFLDIAIER